MQVCSSLAEIELGDWDGVRHTCICPPLPLVLESDLHRLRRRLPFLRHIDFGGEVRARQCTCLLCWINVQICWIECRCRTAGHDQRTAFASSSIL